MICKSSQQGVAEKGWSLWWKCKIWFIFLLNHYHHYRCLFLIPIIGFLRYVTKSGKNQLISSRKSSNLFLMITWSTIFSVSIVVCLKLSPFFAVVVCPIAAFSFCHWAAALSVESLSFAYTAMVIPLNSNHRHVKQWHFYWLWVSSNSNSWRVNLPAEERQWRNG